MADSKATMAKNVRACTPYLVCKNAEKAVQWYRDVLGAKVLGEPYKAQEGQFAGKIMHAEIQVGDQNPSVLFICDEMGDKNQSPQTLGGTPVSLYFQCEDCDALYKKCCQAGATSLEKPTDQFWGDRWSLIADPFGHIWHIATHQEDVSKEEMTKRARKMGM